MSETQTENTNETDIDEVVTEDRSKQDKPKRRRRGLGFLLFILILVGGGVAAWHYQSMWLPQAKETWLPQAREWLASLWPVEEEVDPIAAPAVDRAYLGKTPSRDSYVLKAIPDPQPVQAATEDKTQGPAREIASTHKAVSEVVDNISTDSVVEHETAAASPAETPLETAVAKVEDSPAEVVAKETTAASPDETPLETAVAKVEDSPAEVVARETAAASPDETPLETAVAKVEDSPADVNTANMSTASTTAAPAATDNVAAMVDIQQARQAYWARNLILAETAYKKVLKGDADNTDAWGELGNVYYMQAKWVQAAEAYAEAAIRLLKKGDLKQAMYLRYVVQGLDPQQATRVDEELKRMQAAAQG